MKDRNNIKCVHQLFIAETAPLHFMDKTLWHFCLVLGLKCGEQSSENHFPSFCLECLPLKQMTNSGGTSMKKHMWDPEKVDTATMTEVMRETVSRVIHLALVGVAGICVLVGWWWDDVFWLVNVFWRLFRCRASSVRGLVLECRSYLIVTSMTHPCVSVCRFWSIPTVPSRSSPIVVVVVTHHSSKILRVRES